MAKGKMTYQQFVTKYNNTSEDKRQELCASHIVKQYVDYELKITDIRKIAEICNYSTMDDPADETKKKVFFKRNTPFMYYLLKLRLLSHYTNIDIKDGEELKAFNALDEIGALDGLISCIPETEVIKWNTTLEMVNDDIYLNERDLSSFLDTKMDALSMVMGTMLEGLGEITQRLEVANEDN